MSGEDWLAQLNDGAGTVLSLTGVPASIQPRAVLEVDLSAIVHNVSVLQRVARESLSSVMGIVKADAYGHGAVAVVKTLMKYNDLQAFGVATLSEAIELRRAGVPPDISVLVLGASLPDEWMAYSEHQIDIMVNSEHMAKDLMTWAAENTLPHRINVNVMLNTGMSRIGLSTFHGTEDKQARTEAHLRTGRWTVPPQKKEAQQAPVNTEEQQAAGSRLRASQRNWQQAPMNTEEQEGGASSGREQVYHGLATDDVGDAAGVIKQLAQNQVNSLRFQAICTHMCDAKKTSDYTEVQFTRVAAVVRSCAEQGVHIPKLSIENSESLLSECVNDDELKELLLKHGEGQKGKECRAFARTGGGMYGQRNHADLKPVCTLKAQVRHVHIIEKDTPVGYDRSWVANEECVIATVGIGFADGFPRGSALAADDDREVGIVSKDGTAIVGKVPFTIAGKVCMDMIMVNCGPPEGEGGEIEPGDWCILYGKDGPSLKSVAEQLGTAQSDVTCGLGRRIPRNYVNLPPDREDEVKPSSLSLSYICSQRKGSQERTDKPESKFEANIDADGQRALGHEQMSGLPSVIV